MRIQLGFNKVSRAGDISDKVKAKMGKLEKYLRGVSNELRSGFVQMAKGDKWGYKVKMGLKLPRQEVVAEAKEETLLSAIDRAYGRLAREVRKRLERYKDKSR